MSTPDTARPPSLMDIQAAAVRIAPYVHRTPVLTCATLDALAGRSLFFKCENFQKIGAFKIRGGCNAIMGLSEEDARAGVVTHSSGNHAQAVALAAAIRGIPASIVMPTTSSVVKLRAVKGYGATVHLCEPNEASRKAVAAEVIARTGAMFIPPFDHPAIIAGQGTMALELLDEIDSIDAVIAPIGGGGMMSGVAIAAHGVNPAIKVFGVEPSGADDAARSLAAGTLIPQTAPDTIADGLLTSMGPLTWSVIRDHVDSIFTSSDQEIIAAMRLVWERMKIVIEPSAATAVAGVLSEAFQAAADQSRLKRVGVILSGGNVDLDRLPWVGL